MQKPSDSQWTILELIKWTTAYFQSHDIDSPRLAVELLLAEMLGLERIDLYVRHDQPLSAEELSRFKRLIKRRLHREPLAYILGRRDFWEASFAVDSNVLIPRPETEILVEAAIMRIPSDPGSPPMRILELGTGCGAVIVSLAAARPGHLFFASDAMLPALEVARKNAEANGVADQVRFFAGSWLRPVSRTAGFDMILSNPPYVPCGQISSLAPEISRHEPAAALDGGDDGLDAVRRIIGSAPDHMNPGARILMEIGDGQAAAVEEMVRERDGLEGPRFIRDYGGCERVMEAGRTV
jgi:release factor glutamine methyltransferase